MTKYARWNVALFLIALPLAFSNCSTKMGSAIPSGGGGGGFPVIVGSGTGKPVPASSTTSYTVAGDGTITVYQDKELNFSPAGSSPSGGPFSISALPAWATSFNTTTGTIVGTPHHLTDAGTFTISDSGTTSYGPFTVVVVGDTFKDQQWHLLNTAQKGFAFTAGTVDQDIHSAQSVKANYLGIGVRVAISDSGAVIAHPDLTDNVLPNESRNYLNTYSSAGTWLGDPTPASDTPENAHGTAVAGLFAAKGWNGIGGRGVAPESRIAVFLYLQAQDALSQMGYYDYALFDQFAGSFDVFNFSWGDPQCMLTEYSSAYGEKLRVGVTTQRGGLGSAYVMASGNSFTQDISDCYPNDSTGDFVLGNSNFSEANTTPYTINVAAVNADGVASSYSSPGAANWISTPGGEFGYSDSAHLPSAPELAQPALITTDYPGCNNGISSLHKTHSAFDLGGSGNTGCSYTSTMNGTSGATPIAGGAIAMILQANPNLTWRDIKYILAYTADKVDPTLSLPDPPTGTGPPGYTYEQGWITNAAGFHFHNWYGFGRINVDAAIALAKNFAVQLGTFRSTGFKYNSGTISSSIPDNSATGVSSAMGVTDAMSIEAVQLRASVDGCASDVGLELVSPSGTKSILMNIDSQLRDGAILNHIFLSNAFYGEASAGTWTLKVVDGKAGCTAKLTNWQLNFFGH